jgi:hypothetical protein
MPDVCISLASSWGLPEVQFMCNVWAMKMLTRKQLGLNKNTLTATSSTLGIYAFSDELNSESKCEAFEASPPCVQLVTESEVLISSLALLDMGK